MRRKKIFLIGPPFRGHLHPLLGIGSGLREKADVMLLSTPGGAAEAMSAGLDSRAILADKEDSVWKLAEPATEVKGNPFLLYQQLKENVALLPGLKAELEAIFQEEKPDLVIADFTVPVAGIVAREQGIPWWSSVPSPCVMETPDGPPAYFGGLSRAETWSDELLHAVLRKATRMFKRGMWWWFRAEFREIGFPGIYREDGSERVYSDDLVLGLSVPEIEFPGSYPPAYHAIGPVLHAPLENGDGPGFETDGRPHVLVTLGTHLPHAKVRVAEAIRMIAKRHPGVVFHFSHGRSDVQIHGEKVSGEGNFRSFSHVSYAAHLARYDLVVHHGGAGVMHHCLRHGKAAVVYPHDFDQFDYAARLVAKGLALRVKRPADLEGAILKALVDTEMRERCRAMAEIHRRYDALEFIRARVKALVTSG